jgi:hypothetical protein
MVVVAIDFEWNSESIPLGVHKGACNTQFEHVLGQLGLFDRWEDAEDFVSQLHHNFDLPVRIQEDGILGPSPTRIDLELTGALLAAIGSPLIRPGHS